MKRFLLILLLILFSFIYIGCGFKEEAEDLQQVQTQEEATEDSISDILDKGQQLSSMSYEYSLTAPDMDLSGKVWISGNKVKSETTMDGQPVIMIFDGDDGVFYSYDPLQKQAFKFIGEKSEQGMVDTPIDYSNEIDQVDLKVLDTVVLDGVRCKVIDAGTDEYGTTKMWVSIDYGIPVRIETTLPDGTQTVMKYKNLKFDEVSADTFLLPSDVQVIDLEGMMKDLTQ